MSGRVGIPIRQVGAVQSGIRLNASCSPFDVVPPELWQRFKQAVMESGKQWGLRITFGQDDGSIAQAEQRYWEMVRVGTQTTDG